ARAAPPNVPRRPTERDSPAPAVGDPGPLGTVTDSIMAGRRLPPTYLLAGPGNRFEALEPLIGAVLDTGRSVMVVAPTAVEVEEAGAALAAFEQRIDAIVPDLSAAKVTTRWGRAATQSGRLLIGTERIAFWPVKALGLVVVIEEGRRAMKARQTPTVHVREVVRTRSAVEGFAAVFVGVVPTTELVAAGAHVVRGGGGRLWPLVEVDRTEEPPGAGVITDRVRIALRATVGKGGTAFVFTHRRGYAPAFRCVSCRALRICPDCGSAADHTGLCRRCGKDLGPCLSCGRRRFEPLGAAVGRVIDELRHAVGVDKVGDASSGCPVVVGTERDLPGARMVDLAIAVDADGLIHGTNYRSREDALRMLARLAGLVASGPGRRMAVQTSRPDNAVLTALRRADPMSLLQEELADREAFGFPPVGSLIVLEARNPPDWAAERVATDMAGKATVHGPAATRDATRWLIQGLDLTEARQALRRTVQELRDGGATVRIDADPVDL
ncbi:MAG: hypothetical protein OEO77_14040, partial [Acidimicrobiia bacterium]|nr:hypothetical protein [Acidimicrobiia bacterium]